MKVAKPINRTSPVFALSTPTMWMVGCNSRSNNSYSWNLEHKALVLKLQPILDYLELVFTKFVQPLLPPGDIQKYSPCHKDFHSHVLNFKSFKKMAVTYNYTGPTHIDCKDATHTIFITFRKSVPSKSSPGYFYHSSAKKYFRCLSGDIVFFNGCEPHGTSPTGDLCYKFCIALYS